jgi:hypothetical protein
MKKLKKLSTHHIRSANHLSKANLPVFALVFAAIGGYVIYSSFAAGFTTSFEAENSTKNSPAVTISDASASGGSALKFASGGSSSCPLPAYPNASCTGVPAGTTLTTVSGDLTVSTNNTTISAKNVTGCILVEATGVIIKDSRAECVWANNAAAQNPANGPVTIQDSEINCGNVTGGGHFGTGLGPINLSVIRTNIHGCENGASVDGNFTLKDSYVHDLYQCPLANCPEPGSPHTDGIETADTSSNINIDHNTIYGFSTGCVFPNSGTCNGTSSLNINTAGIGIHDVTISNNLLAGGAHTLYCPTASTTRMSITGNHFSTIYSPNVGEFDASQDCSGENWSGNVHHESGRTITVSQQPPY